MSRNGKGKSPKAKDPRQSSAFLIWIAANRRSWTALLHPNPSVAIDTPLMKLLSGIAPGRDCRSTRLWSRYRIFLGPPTELTPATDLIPLSGRIAAT